MDFLEIYKTHDFNNIEKKYNLNFDDKKILVKAFIHPSYISGINQNYQRLEFLGDSILDFVVADYMYRHLWNDSEGEMSRLRAALVSADALAYIVKKEELHHYLLVGKSLTLDNKEASNFSNSYVADIFESFVAAIYLDQGMLVAKEFIHEVLISNMEKITNKENVKDYKTTLQEILQQGGKVDIRYESIEVETGFRCELYYSNLLIGVGSGNTKKKAEQAAAKKAIDTKVY